jgi:hypothetical protein
MCNFPHEVAVLWTLYVESYKGVSVRGGRPCSIFLNGGTAGRGAARSPVNRAYAHIANVIGRYHPVPLRPSY